jgi:excisionase family DNA binding protein
VKIHSIIPVFAGARQHRRSMKMEPLAYSINETARTLSLGRTSIYALINEGRLETVKLGRRTLIKTASIRALIDGQP